MATKTDNQLDHRTQGVTNNDLVNAMWDCISQLDNDETTPAKVNAKVNATNAILRTVKLTMDYHKQIGTKPSIAMMLTESNDNNNGDE